MSFSSSISGLSPILPQHKFSLIFRFGKYNFYIFTRKDPFPGSQEGNKSTSTTEVAVYGQTILKQGGDANTTIGTNIQNPHWFSWYRVQSTTYEYCPNTTPYYNSWSARNNDVWSGNTSSDNIVVKTVYDPCPVGYTVAPVNAFSGMTNTNGWSSTDIGSLQQGCWFPGVGYRNYGNSGDLVSVGTQSRSWYAVPSSTSAARRLYFTSGTANPASSLERAHGASVRPVEEIEKKN